MLENAKAKEYCRKCVNESNADCSTGSNQADNSQEEDNLEAKGNSETALTALLTLAGIEGELLFDACMWEKGKYFKELVKIVFYHTEQSHGYNTNGKNM